jgi:hypothetical protein
MGAASDELTWASTRWRDASGSRLARISRSSVRRCVLRYRVGGRVKPGHDGVGMNALASGWVAEGASAFPPYDEICC